MGGGRCRGGLDGCDARGRFLFPLSGWYQFESSGVNSCGGDGGPSLLCSLSGRGLVRGLLGRWGGGALD